MDREEPKFTETDLSDVESRPRSYRDSSYSDRRLSNDALGIGHPMKILIAMFLLAILTSPASAQEEKSYWRTPEGTPIPESTSRKSVGSMTGMILITSDQDWQAKWNTPKETVPHFTEASEVARDGTLFLLAFFGNPGQDEAGRSKPSCDFTLVRPDGTFAVEQHDVECFPNEAAIERDTTYMTNITIGFKADSSEPKGSWTYRFVLKDRITNIYLPLEAGFTVN